MTKLSSKLKEELFALLPPTIFFFVALHIVAFVRVLMLKKTGIAPSSSISIAVAALILGKAVLIADMLPLINRFPNKPLIYNVAWKTVIYLLLSARCSPMPRMAALESDSSLKTARSFTRERWSLPSIFTPT